MNAKLFQYWDTIRTSYWFVPSLMAVASTGLAFGMLTLDESIADKSLTGYSWIYTGGPDGARGVLSAIASSMITVAGVVFSITIVVLSLTTQQYGPRLLRNFLKDQGTQVVLGAFVASFLYSLLILRNVRGSDFGSFVPHISVTVAVLLAIGSVAVLIYFIHHIAARIQVDDVIAAAHAELREAIERLYPVEIGKGPPGSDHPTAAAEAAAVCTGQPSTIFALREGYVQGIDADGLIQRLAKQKRVAQIDAKPGDYVLRGQTVARVWPASNQRDWLQSLSGLFVIGQARTTRQDCRFAVRQLVEIALRALSPGVNDPFTAISCLNRLAGALSDLAGREIPSIYRFDSENRLRVIARPESLTTIVREAFTDIRHYARNSLSVMVELLDAVHLILNHAKRYEDRAYLWRFAETVKLEALEGIKHEDDRDALLSAFAELASSSVVGNLPRRNASSAPFPFQPAAIPPD